MNLNFMNKMLEQNPALSQLLQLKTMLDKLPQSKQEELVTEFINSLNKAVKEQESNNEA